MNKVECHICGELVKNIENCEICGSDLTVNEFSQEEAELLAEDCCLNCEFYSPAEEIECPVLAKKWSRDKIEIDCPDTMHCEVYKNDKT